MRLRTLPVSISGVLAGSCCALFMGDFNAIPALLCLLFAILAQIASNFGNEYYDYKKGIDRKGREGFRRGVTEGDITPYAMKCATFGTLAVAACIGLLMLFYSSWWIIPAGICIGLSALAYSAGPYPLSHHGLGDVAVIVFFGIVPVTLTCYLQQGSWEGIHISLPVSVATGLMAANVLAVNNYRDLEDDKASGKNTTAVIFGRKAIGWAYLFSGIAAAAIASAALTGFGSAALTAPAIYLALHTFTWKKLVKHTGATLNPILGETARNVFIFALMLLAAALIFNSTI